MLAGLAIAEYRMSFPEVCPVAHVASDLKSMSLNRMLPQGGKASHAADRTAAAPFDSILDETARPAPEPRQKRATDDKPRAERPDRAERTDRPKSADRPEHAAKPDDTAKPADAPASADSAKDAAIDSQTGEPVPAEQAASEGETKTPETTEQAGEAKPAEAATPEAVAVVIDPAIAAAAQVDTKQDIKTAAIAATAGAANAAEATPDTAAEAGADAALADAFPDALAALAAKAEKSDKKDTDKPALAAKDAHKAVGNAETALHADAAAQAAEASEPHKNSGAHASAQDTANSHRGVSDKPAAPAADTAATATPAAAPKLDLAPPPNLMTAQAPAHATQAAAAVTASAPSQNNATDAAVPVAGVAFEITSKVMSGKNQFDIRLDPAELGRIHVRLDVDREGNVVTHMIADRPDTLDMLRKDTAGLERALQDAGLKTSDNSLQFSLRDQQANQQQNDNGGSNSARIVVEDEQANINEPAVRNYAAYRSQAGGLDIRV